MEITINYMRKFGKKKVYNLVKYELLLDELFLGFMNSVHVSWVFFFFFVITKFRYLTSVIRSVVVYFLGKVDPSYGLFVREHLFRIKVL